MKIKTNGNHYVGNISSVRSLEDCIRATKKYSEGVHIMATNHPIQGAEFPSKKFCKYYEFYPDMETGWVWAAEMVFGNPRAINITFIYDYRKNKAEVQLKRIGDVAEMETAVPGFRDAIRNVIMSQTVQEVKS